jgi:hypothetical protein
LIGDYPETYQENSMAVEPEKDNDAIPMIQRVTAILWPSFLTAGVATVLFFTAFDPIELAALLGYEDITRTGAYSIGFFSFWVLTSFSCLVSGYFLRPCSRVNEPKREAKHP